MKLPMQVEVSIRLVPNGKAHVVLNGTPLCNDTVPQGAKYVPLPRLVDPETGCQKCVGRLNGIAARSA